MVEMQFGDFISCGFNQIVNNLATTHYRWGAGVPVVIRAPVGGGMGAGPFHSQDVEGWFTHVAGLKVVAPATPADAKGLLLSAFDDGNPVLYLEHKFLYRTAIGPVPEGWHTVPIGRAAIARPGTDATVVTYGVGVMWAVEAADRLAAEDGVEVEVVDLRSLRPWDVETVLDVGRADGPGPGPPRGAGHRRVRRRGGGDHRRAGVRRDSTRPCVRLGALDTPVPFAKSLEAHPLTQGSGAADAPPAARLLALGGPVSPTRNSASKDETGLLATLSAREAPGPAARLATAGLLVRRRLEAVAHARLGHEVAGPRRIGLELAPHVSHVHPQVVGLLAVLRAPHLL